MLMRHVLRIDGGNGSSIRAKQHHLCAVREMATHATSKRVRNWKWIFETGSEEETIII